MAKTASSMRLATPPNPVPLGERGRMLFIRDVQALLGTTETGGFRKSAWWVKNYFAPDYKRKLGRDPYWWEIDALRWLDEQRGAR